jgi:hypothetical protein
MRLLVLVAVALVVTACAHEQVELEAIRGDWASLGPREGLLLVHTELRMRLDRISLGDAWIEAPPQRESLTLYAVPAGEYRWSELVRDWGRFVLEPAPRLTFRGQAGVLNYPGQLVVRSAPGGAEVFTRNRGAMVLDLLERQYPDIYRTHALIYTGFQRDDFYRYYHSLPRKDRDWKKELRAL